MELTVKVRVGVHVSISGSIDRAVDRAVELGCGTFQMFTRNPRGWHAKPLGEADLVLFRRKLAESSIVPAVAHMPYLPNLASAKIDMYEKSVDALTVEVDRCGRLGIPYLVTHLGSHLGEGRESGLARIGAAVNRALASTASGVMLLLENTAGTRNSMGSTFEDVLGILNEVRDGGRVGVCLDTAHAYAAGYDLHTESSVADAVRKFDAVIGLSRLKVVHLNDSAVGLGGGRDRHEHIGMGYIGEAGCRAILRNDNLSGLPFIMETPVDARRGCAGDLSKALELAGS